MRKLILAAAAGLMAMAAASPGNATAFFVDAKANSSSGGVGLASLFLGAGQHFTVSSSLNDLWSAGGLPRWSDANGLTVVRFKSAADDATEASGVQIGQNFGSYAQGNLSAAYGSLVGQIEGTTNYFLLGASGSYVAPATGILDLFYWDSNNGDNAGGITFDITAVPEPSTWAMMFGGFALLGAVIRRRARTAISFA